MKNIAFIVNPIAGIKTKNRVSKLIRELLDTEQYSPSIVVTEYAGHATQLAHQFALEGYYAVIAVGGDGTVNEVASGLRDTNTALGVVPNGSGNGFARHLDISTRMNRAIEMLNSSEVINIDYCMVNEQPYFATLGVGFDALVAQEFSCTNKDLKGYIESIFKNIVQYQPEQYYLQGDGIDIKTNAFLISFANVSQWGNDACIAPKASIQDGWIDIAILNEFPLIKVPELAWQLFTRNIDENHYMHTIRTKEITLIRENTSSPVRIDGSPIQMGKELHIKIIEDGLKVLVKKRF
jgi:YegS/Rv2252/BmrU family lipid kinase